MYLEKSFKIFFVNLRGKMHYLKDLNKVKLQMKNVSSIRYGIKTIKIKKILLLVPRMFLVWDFVVGIFARKAMLNIGWVLSTLIVTIYTIKKII